MNNKEERTRRIIKSMNEMAISECEWSDRFIILLMRTMSDGEIISIDAQRIEGWKPTESIHKICIPNPEIAIKEIVEFIGTDKVLGQDIESNVLKIKKVVPDADIDVPKIFSVYERIETFSDEQISNIVHHIFRRKKEYVDKNRSKMIGSILYDIQKQIKEIQNEIV